MLIAGVIHDEIKADTDTSAVTRARELLQVFHGPKFRFYLAEIGYCVSAVASGAVFRRVKERHKMHILYSAFLEVLELFSNTIKVACKVLRIQHHAHHPV